jgi:hypothetical protein
MEFQPYPKTPRLKRSVTITEKIDGTNAQIVITVEPHGLVPRTPTVAERVTMEGILAMRVGSRNRWITPGKDTDNYGFAQWCQGNADELFKLGEGQHFGEWYRGIGRNYGLDHRRFALFNTARWGDHNPNTPACCNVVPVLAQCGLDAVTDVIAELEGTGSRAVPGFMNPEGIIVYHSASKQNFKVLLENDEIPKGVATLPF